MNDQGLVYALLQFWTVEDKPRLNRRNTWFNDHQINSKVASYFWIVFTVLAMAMGIFMVVSCL